MNRLLTTIILLIALTSVVSGASFNVEVNLDGTPVNTFTIQDTLTYLPDEPTPFINGKGWADSTYNNSVTMPMVGPWLNFTGIQNGVRVTEALDNNNCYDGSWFGTEVLVISGANQIGCYSHILGYDIYTAAIPTTNPITERALTNGIPFSYSTTNGTAITEANPADAGLVTFEVDLPEYGPVSLEGVNVSSGTYTAELVTTNVSFNCFEYLTNNTLTCAETIIMDALEGERRTDEVNVTGYFSHNVSYTTLTGSPTTINVSDFYNFDVTIEVLNYNGTPAEFYNLTITNALLSYNETVQGDTRFELLKGYDYDVNVTSTNGVSQLGSLTFTNLTPSGAETRIIELNMSTIPSIESVEVSNITTTILGTANISDKDSDNQTVDYRWYKNGALYDSGTKTIASPGSYNLDNLTGAEYVSGDLLIFSVRSTDGVSTTDWQNSTAFLAEDTTPPTLENATQPGTVVQNNAGTFTVQVTDNGVLDSVTVSWLDPNSITSGLLSMSLSSGNTYTRSFTFTTTGTYSNVTFTATDGNGLTETLSGLNFTVTEASGGGGGGGGSTIEVPNEVSGTLDAQPIEVYIGPFNSGGELIITNEESSAKSFTLRLASTNLTDRISFAGSETVTLIVEGQGSLSGNKKFVSYTVDREELPEGDYTATFELLDEAGRIVDSTTVTISSRSSPLSGLISGFGTPIFGTITAGTLVALIAFATIAGVLIFRTPRAKATSRRKT